MIRVCFFIHSSVFHCNLQWNRIDCNIVWFYANALQCNNLQNLQNFASICNVNIYIIVIKADVTFSVDLLMSLKYMLHWQTCIHGWRWPASNAFFSSLALFRSVFYIRRKQEQFIQSIPEPGECRDEWAFYLNICKEYTEIVILDEANLLAFGKLRQKEFQDSIE